eukprot:6682756-Prymnesium_polylepis.1
MLGLLSVPFGVVGHARVVVAQVAPCMVVVQRVSRGACGGGGRQSQRTLLHEYARKACRFSVLRPFRRRALRIPR